MSDNDIKSEIIFKRSEDLSFIEDEYGLDLYTLCEIEPTTGTSEYLQHPPKSYKSFKPNKKILYRTYAKGFDTNNKIIFFFLDDSDIIWSLICPENITLPQVREKLIDYYKILDDWEKVFSVFLL